jgi:ribonucleotide reductase alpha subunit
MSEGKLQYHLWGIKDEDLLMGFDWKSLAEDIKTNGVRNSLLTALMPTASTAQIMGNCESFEPYHSNIFVRETLAGEFIIVNKNLMRDLIKENIWSEKIRKKIIIDNGSIQNISEIPQKYKDIYKTAFEIKLKDIIDQSADRGIFIDQSQSLNLFMGESDRNKLHSAHIHSWKRGLKTAMYYLRSRPATDPINFGLDIEEIKELKKEMGDKKEKICKWRPGVKLSECDMCSA